MRLIDADSLYDALGNKLTWLMGYGDEVYLTVGNDIRDKIDAQPTAYNVDKVVEELESFAKLAEDRWVNGTSKHAYQEHKCWVKAIEIVKQCGVSDDVCEWRKSKDYPFDWLVGCDGCKVNHRQGDYCPRCGKKIKIVGE